VFNTNISTQITNTIFETTGVKNEHKLLNDVAASTIIAAMADHAAVSYCQCTVIK
jgi:hypothetical protein